jgi:enoyl-CoA hydratase/carnithine racemase
MTIRSYQTLEVEEVDPGVLLVALNRPDRFNAMTNTMFDELERLTLAIDETRIRVVILTGRGRAFCSGYDLADAEHLAGLGALGMLSQQERAARAMRAIRTLKMPVIAAVNGAAAGGGFALALAADIRIASPQAKFNAAFVRIGLSAGDLGTSWLLTRLVGPAVTSDICFTGRSVDADEAARYGIANEVAPDAVARARELALAILANAPGGVRLSKTALQANVEGASYGAALEMENRGQSLLTRTTDMSEALAAMRERRSANFQGA